MTTKTHNRSAFNPYLGIPSNANNDCNNDSTVEDPDPDSQITYQRERGPSNAEIKELLQDEIRHLTLEEVGRHTFIESTPTELRIGKGTKFAVELTKLENEDIKIVHFQDFQLIQSRKSKNPFAQAWSEMLKTCEREITNHLDKRYPRHEFSAIREPEVKKMATAIANSTLAITGYGFTKNPTQLASAVLHKFLGKDRVSRTLRIAGSRATISDFLIIQQRTELFTRSHEINPNATVLWFTWAGVDQIEKLEPGTTPETIIEDARQIFMNPSTFREQMTDEEWNAFCSLNRMGVNHYPPAKWNTNIANICKVSAATGRMPSYSAIREISRFQRGIHVKTEMLEPFITESERRTKNPKLGTQKQLMAEFRAVGDHMRIHPQAAPSNDRTGEWEAWSDLLPRDWARNQPKNEKPKRNDPTHRRSTQRPDTQATATAAREMTEILRGPAGQAVMKLIENAVTLESEPGSRVILRTKGDTQPHLIIRMAESGNIIFNSPEYWTKGINIPDPDQNSEPESGAESGAEPGLNSTRAERRKSMLNHRSRSMGISETRWTLRGLYPRTARKLAINMIQEDWTGLRTSQDQPVPTQKAITTALNTFWSTQPKELQPWTMDGILSLELERSIAEMADRETWNQVNDLGLGVSISRYNIAAGMKDLIRTNPGAAVWAITHCEPTEEIRHPGQVIRMAKEDLDNHGADPRCWKFIAGLPANIMQKLMQKLNCTTPNILNTIFLLNAMGRGGTVPHLMVMDDISNELRYKNREVGLQDENGGDNPHHTNNLIRVIQLTCQESSDNHENEDQQSRIIQEATEIIDYVRHMNREGRTIESKTYRGLTRKSDIWHRGLNEERINKQWNELIQRQDGQYCAWTSAIDQPFTEGPYTITPLKSEYDLYRESLNMNHCVIQYGRQCTNHSSRIFSIGMNGRKLATAEITKNLHRWDTLQAKGPHNHPVSDEVEQLAARIAELYSEKHSTAPERHEKTWMEPATTASL